MVVSDLHRKVAAENPFLLKVYDAGEAGASYQFQPGDGTRYVCTVRTLTDAECGLPGCSPEARMVSIMRGSNTFVTACFHGAPYANYLAEKLGLNTYNSRAWERLLAFIFRDESLEPLPFKEG